MMRAHRGKNLFPFLWGALFLLIFTQSVFAVPAAPGLHSLTQPDGTVIKARQWGDEWSNGWETEDGFTIMQHRVSRQWTYADRDFEGNLISSSRVVGRDLPVGPEKRLRPSGKAKVASQATMMQVYASEAAPVPPVPYSQKILVIMVDFIDTSGTDSASSFQSLFFSATSGSVAKYYDEVSYGNFNVVAAAETHDVSDDGVVGWVTLNQNHPDCENATNISACYQDLASSAIQAADPYIDFAVYDTNNNGLISTGELAIILVIAGHEYAYGGVIPSNRPGVWAHRWSLWSPVVLDGKAISQYAMFGEKHGSHQATIGVMTHELGHLMLGLPDLYDTDGSSEGIGNWSLMAGGSWNYVSIQGDRPAHLDAWCKYYLGWVSPTEVTAPLTDEPISQAATSPDIYKLRSGSPLSGEYFLVENRQKSGFDAGLPGSGLLIWHIDGNKISSLMGSNTVNNTECYPPSNCSVNHFGVALIQADNLWSLEKGDNRGDAGDTYKSTGNVTFDGTSSPNSNFYNGSASNISVTNVSVPGATMFATLQSSQPTVQFQSASSSGGEATTPALITVTLSATSGQTVTVNYATADGMATAGSDYTATSGTLTFNPGEISKTINVPITNDSIVEADETFTVSLSSPSKATLGTTTTHTYTILNDDFAGTLQFSASNYSVNENGGTVTITATRTGGSSGAVSVAYATSNGTAISGTDYTATSGTLSWANGDAANKTFTVSITNDALNELNETFTVTLSVPTGGAVLGSPAPATVTIMDDDPVPTVQFQSASSSGGEATTPALITVTLSATSGQTVTVNYATADGMATAGSDYTATSGTLTFNPGEISKTINVPITNDSIVEADETFTVSLSSPSKATLGTTTTHTYTILNDDFAGTLQFSASNYSVNENGGTVTITATRTGGSSGAVSVAYATSNGTAISGTDYTATSGTLSWANGDAANKIFAVSITNDVLDEQNETFSVSLSSPTGGATLGTTITATVTIMDDDLAPTVQFQSAASSGGEATTPALITVTLSATSGQTVTVNYATADGMATAGSDYTATSGTLTFNPGEISKTINVPITNDSIVEADETFTVNLSSPVNATLGATIMHTYTINNDDSYGTIQLSSATYRVNENDGTISITVTRTGGSSGSIGVSYATTGGTAESGTDYAATSGALAWTDGDATDKTLTVSIMNDSDHEVDETFRIILENPTGGATLGSPDSATVTITDDDSNAPIVLNMLKNPDFEEGHVNWSEYSREGYELISEEPLYTFNGNWMAILGGSTRRSYLYQDVKIPSDAMSASLDFWFNIVSEESPNGAYDIMKLEVRRPSDNVLLLKLDKLSNLDVTGGWAQSRAYDLMPFRGQDIRLRFKAKNGPSNTTAFYLDDLAVTVSRKINLESPNGGETIAAGSIYDIQFRTVSEVSSVKIKYTLNNGRTWKTITAGVTGTSYPWDVPVPARTKTKCKIKVIGYDAAGHKVGKDDSDETFTIVR